MVMDSGYSVNALYFVTHVEGLLEELYTGKSVNWYGLPLCGVGVHGGRPWVSSISTPHPALF